MASSNAEKDWIPRLGNEQGFANWKFRVRMLLEERQVWSVMEIEDKKYTSEDFQKDAKAKNIIVQCITDKYLEIVKKCKTAKEMMTQLEQTFERKSIFNKLHLKRKLLALKCTQSEKLQDYFLKFDTLLNQLTAAGCTVDEMDKICYLLSSMPSHYDNVITSIETMTTENSKTIDIDFVKARLLDAEVKGQSSSGDHQPQAAFLSCYRCGRQGHKAIQCRGRGRGQGNFRGHSFRQESARGQGRGYSRGQGRGRAQGSTAMAIDSSDQVSFVASEYSLSVNDCKNDIRFVIDSGATQNLIIDCYEKYMTNIQYLNKETRIFVANGQYLISNKRGTLNVMYDNIPIKIEALIVKGLAHNLLSVKTLLQKGNSVSFHENSVSIAKGKIIMYGKMYGSLYGIDLKLNLNECYVASNDKDLWHKRLGHANRKHLGILKLTSSEKQCGPCVEGKSTRLPFVSTPKPTSSYIGELLHTDLSGPISTPTSNGEVYYHSIIDDYSHFTAVYLLKRKNEATDHLIDYIQQIETQTGNKVRKIRCDNGGEFKNDKLWSFSKNKGIIMQFTQPYSPQSNGTAERMNRTIYNKARTILNETGLPKHLWGEAVRCAVYQINRCPSSAINNRVPAKIMNGHLDLSKLRVFGAKAWAVTIPKQGKFEKRAKEMRLVGYAMNGWRLWDPEENQIIISRDVRFDESDIKYKEIEKEKENEEAVIYKEKENEEEIEYEENIMYKTDKCDDTQETSAKEISTHKTRSGREIRKPRNLEEYDMNIAYCLCAGEPINYEEAIQDEDWKQAIKRELDSHYKLGTWEITKLPEGSKAIDTKWIFRQKQDGTKKARLVAKGFQQEGQDEYYAPVARMPTVRTMLSHAVREGLTIKQLDVPTAFLNGELKDNVYIKCPKGVEQEGKVLKLKKALYGLKEAPKCWNEKFHKFMTSNGFTQSKYDFCLYKNEDTWLLIFVDDILQVGNESILKKLKEEFNIKDLGEVKNYLGLEITRKNDRMVIKQTEMIKRVLEKFEMQESRGINTPMESNYCAEEDEIIDVPYKELIGCLLFISMNSRPDITYSVAYLSRFLDKPTTSLWKAAKRILRYLRNTQDKGLIYKRTEEERRLVAYADADWAADKTDRKSTSGCAIFYCGNLIHWFSKKQASVALSTAEAEYVSAALSASELIYLKGIIFDLTSLSTIPTLLLLDNQSAIRLIKSFDNGKRSKHIDIKVHYIKDIVNKKLLSVEYIPTDENVSDLFTKALPKIKHNYFTCKLNLL